MINYKKLIQAVDLIREVLLELDENELEAEPLPELPPLEEPEEIVESEPLLFETSEEKKPEEVKVEVDPTFHEDPRPSVDSVASDNAEDVKPDLSKMSFKELREFYQKNQRKKVK